MSKKITLGALARAAKVSPATVSRVLKGNSAVDPVYRDRVHAAARKLKIDLEERRKDKSRLIAFLLANRDVSHSFQARVLLGAERHFAERNWEVLFMSFNYSAGLPAAALHLPQILNAQAHARGVILAGSNHPNLVEALQARGLPFAVLGNNVFGEWEPARCDVVYSDDIHGAREATRHLISKGLKTIAYIGNLSFPWFARCAQGYLQAMKESRLEPRCIDLRFDDAELGYIGTKKLFSKGEKVSAILAGNDQVAAGVYDALREMKVSIPGEVSVIGFNDTQSAYYQPPLTSVREFPEELGRHLAEFLLNRIAQPDLPPQQVTAPTRLVIRDSVRRVSA
ncbi:MAG: LacI family transcriptional regulator [Verrucomicrobia bacterium]|nr:LacI family transcriptional regulator [Verrucomicrobiota bacterium]